MPTGGGRGVPPCRTRRARKKRIETFVSGLSIGRDEAVGRILDPQETAKVLDDPTRFLIVNSMVGATVEFDPSFQRPTTRFAHRRSTRE
jgi:hypothetical protein